MTIYVGADSWSPPTQAVLDQLKVLSGFHFYAGYVGGPGVWDNTSWPQEAWDLLKANDVAPLPLWVPRQNCSDNPVESAGNALTACRVHGMTGLVVLDTESTMREVLNHEAWIDTFVSTIHSAGWLCVVYEGAGYLPAGAFRWGVVWGEHEEVPEGGEALQYGPYVLHGPDGEILMHSIDGDAADIDFPFATWITAETFKPAPPKPEPEPEPVKRTVTVEEGDSLWSLAEKTLGSGTRWFELYKANEAAIGPNPDLIHAGLVLEVPE